MLPKKANPPIMDPMDFGEPVNWTPLDGTPSLKRRKDAEDEPLFKTQKEMDEYKQWKKESKEKFPKGEVRVVGRDKIDKRSALGKMMSRWGAEGANPSGGATGDQIISWEHNGLSSPSGPPSDIMWAECAAGKEYVQIFDTTITKNGIEVKLHKAGIKPIEVFVITKDTFGVYLQPWDVTAFSKEFNKKDWNGLFEFEAAIDLSRTSPPIAKFNAEGANPSGGATGRPNYLMGTQWTFFAIRTSFRAILCGPNVQQSKEYVQIFDTTITKNGIEVKLHKAGIKH